MHIRIMKRYCEIFLERKSFSGPKSFRPPRAYSNLQRERANIQRTPFYLVPGALVSLPTLLLSPETRDTSSKSACPF